MCIALPWTNRTDIDVVTEESDKSGMETSLHMQLLPQRRLQYHKLTPRNLDNQPIAVRANRRERWGVALLTALLAIRSDLGGNHGMRLVWGIESGRMIGGEVVAQRNTKYFADSP